MQVNLCQSTCVQLGARGHLSGVPPESHQTPYTIHHTPYTTSQACLPSVPARREPRLRDTVYYEAYRKMPKRLYASVPCCPTRLGRAACVRGHGCMIEVGQPRGLGRERYVFSVWGQDGREAGGHSQDKTRRIPLVNPFAAARHSTGIRDLSVATAISSSFATFDSTVERERKRERERGNASKERKE